MKLESLWEKWQLLWFSKQSPIPLALTRIVMGLLVYFLALWLAPDASTFFGPHAIISRISVEDWRGCPQLDLITLLPDTELTVDLILFLLAFCGILLALGLFSRSCALIAYLIIVSLDSRGHFALHTGHAIMMVILLYLSVSRCGDALSLSRLFSVWRKGEPDLGPAQSGNVVSQRLIQVHLSVVYWSAFSNKLFGTTWLNGTAVYYATHQLGFVRFPVPYLFDHLWTCQLLSWGTIAVEFALCSLIWIKELCLPILLIGFIFHAGLEWALVLPLFEYVMITCYLCFISIDDYRRFASYVRNLACRLAGGKLTVIYDSSSSFSLRMSETVRRLDILHLLDIKDRHGNDSSPLSQAQESGWLGLWAINKSEVLEGQRALQSISRRLPLLALPAIALYLPGLERFLQSSASRLAQSYR